MVANFFSDQNEFRRWLEHNHNKKTELVVGYYKVATKKLSMTWSESVDQALCFGWIDGIRRSIDRESYSIRFTPRLKTSNWSAINIKKIEELTKKGLMWPAGIEAFANRKIKKSSVYSFENNISKFSLNLENLFKKNEVAWSFFMKQAPSYRKTLIHWVMSAKRETTQILRIEKLIKESEKQKRI